ncbi:hypothetical protein METHB2_220001 [Candidatus Methylobacter favarea]|uniref:Uncharacterized protein n=1 Tax=Candidatus Methylobacter favarea TaxID=2707345 RepID=A0A8S0WA26_9GAMM|nr:hypothetical protein [Candidatus Methylobacter favarea]CAA9890429.1 hypothetical protein METHB2_220001 [Candidatus Methylobacter favarea]
MANVKFYTEPGITSGHWQITTESPRLHRFHHNKENHLGTMATEELGQDVQEERAGQASLTQ